MHVLVLCGDRGIPLEGPSGASAHLRGVCHALESLGHRVRVATPLRSDHRGSLAPSSLDLVECPPRRWPSWIRERGETWDARRLTRRALDGFTPDLIWERYSLFVDAGARAASALNCPRILEVNAPLSIERPRVRNPDRARRLEDATLQSATAVVAVSQWLTQWTQSRGARRSIYLPNGTDRAPCPEPEERRALRAELGVTGTLVGFVGSCRPWHGLDRLPAILDADPELHALVVGDGPAPPPTHPRLHHVGRQPPHRLNAWLSAMDVGLDLRTADAPPWLCPLKIADYRAAGLPVVSEPCVEAERLAEGAWFPTSDDRPDAWVQAIHRALQVPAHPTPRPWTHVIAEALEALG